MVPSSLTSWDTSWCLNLAFVSFCTYHIRLWFSSTGSLRAESGFIQLGAQEIPELGWKQKPLRDASRDMGELSWDMRSREFSPDLACALPCFTPKLPFCPCGLCQLHGRIWRGWYLLRGKWAVSSSKKSGPHPFPCSPWGIKASVINGVLTQCFWSVQELMANCWPSFPQSPGKGLEYSIWMRWKAQAWQVCVPDRSQHCANFQWNHRLSCAGEAHSHHLRIFGIIWEQGDVESEPPLSRGLDWSFLQNKCDFWISD